VGAVAALDFVLAYAGTGASRHVDGVALAVLEGARRALDEVPA
jgi:hypothetical protein